MPIEIGHVADRISRTIQLINSCWSEIHSGDANDSFSAAWPILSETVREGIHDPKDLHCVATTAIRCLGRKQIR
jgi:hypothetical protein